MFNFIVNFDLIDDLTQTGCHLLGEYMSKIQDDVKRAAKVFKDNCDKNNFARSCTQFGTNLFHGRG